MNCRSCVYRLAFGGLVSTLGTSAAWIALAYFVWNQTHSGLWLSATFLITEGINGLFQPWLGSLGDRFDRKKVMIIADCVAGIPFAVMVVIAEPGPLVALAFVASLGSMAFWPAAAAATPNIVPEEHLTWANGVFSATSSVGRIAGPFIGGAVAAFADAKVVFAVNAVSFFISAVMTWTVHARFQEERDTGPHEHGGLGAGFAFLWNNVLLRNITIAWSLLTIAINIAIVADLPLVQSMGKGGGAYGLLESAVGIGALIGAYLARKTKQSSEWWAILMGSWMTALGYLAVAVSPWYGPCLQLASSWASPTHSRTSPGQRSPSASLPTRSAAACSRRGGPPGRPPMCWPSPWQVPCWMRWAQEVSTVSAPPSRWPPSPSCSRR